MRHIQLAFLSVVTLLEDLLELLCYLTKWILLVIPVGLAVGTACAFFLWLLETVTNLRIEHGWLLYFLPIAGVGVGLLYHWLGRAVEGGSNLIVDEIHEPGGGVPPRIAPLVFIGTILTHLCGGSAGREGTAVQMGGGIASAFSRLFSFLSLNDIRTLLLTGVAAGFGGVFGTPVAGAVFAMEVLAIGRMSYEAVLPCLASAIIADWTCGAWDVGHTPYHIAAIQHNVLTSTGALRIDWLLLIKVVIAGICFGLAARLFSELAHTLQHVIKQRVKLAYFRPALGGIGVILLVYLFGTRDYLGIGVSSPDPHAVTIVSSFQPNGAHTWSWLLKIIFTVVTLSSGFKGGEVTPLFFIGAALGNTLSHLLGVPTDLFTGLGFVAVFAAAANTPLACTVMAVELFGVGGGAQLVYYAVACFVAYFFSGHAGIYLSQRLGTPKIATRPVVPEPSSISAREIWENQESNRRSRLKAANKTLNQPQQEPVNTEGESTMKTKREHKVVGQEMGYLRIYLNASMKGRPVEGWKKILGAKPLYREIVALAKADGILHATVHNTIHGYSGKHQRIESDITELPNPMLSLCVEFIDHRNKLEKFCRDHADLLKGRILLYKHVEHWDIHDNLLNEKDATLEELVEDKNG